MVNVKDAETRNYFVEIKGILKDLDISEGVDKNGNEHVRGTATIRVDQEVDGKMTENVVPIRMFSKKKTRDGADNKVYQMIEGYKENLTPLASVEDVSKATKVRIKGELRENSYVGQDGEIRTGWEVSSNFINIWRPIDESDAECATFEFMGAVIGKMSDEFDRNGDETGRMKMRLITFGYMGRANVIEVIVDSSKKAAVENLYNEGDTIYAIGQIVDTYKSVKYEEEMAIGEPVIRTRTETRRELMFVNGSRPFEEDKAFDADSVKLALSDRAAYLDGLKNAPVKKAAPVKKVSLADDFGF